VCGVLNHAHEEGITVAKFPVGRREGSINIKRE